MATQYGEDVIRWAEKQAQLLRFGNLDQLDIEHIAEEIDDVGTCEVRDLSSRIS
ncbi:MAG: DUF29 family protein [Deltaproteobacteria bacterium]|nr:DUF29 family protein [Deltaproteobacteria bacterium]